MVKPVGKQRYVETSPMTTKRLRFLVRLPGETFHRTWKVPSAKTGKAFVSSFRGVVGFDLIFPLIFSREFQTYTQEDALDLTESFGSIPRFARWWTIQEGSWECKEIRVSWGKFRLMKYYHAGKMRYDLWWHLLDDKICSKVLTIEYGKHISGKNSILFIWNPKPTPSCLQGSPNCWSFCFRACLCLHTIFFQKRICHDSPDVQSHRINVYWYIYL